MKQYKGYYIDNTYFHNEAEIDKFLENKAVEAYITAVKVFLINCTMEASIYANKMAERLVNNFGYTWEQVEEIEIKAMAA